MKKKPTSNRLCLSCRRTCKQDTAAVVAQCPRYYPGPKRDDRDWQQMSFLFPK